MKQKSTIAALDGVRAIAFLAVLVFHIDIVTNSLHIWGSSVGLVTSSVALAGWSGVTLFFILSGFLLFMPYARAILFGEPWPSMRGFYLRRVLRIVPGYYVSLFLLILLFERQYLEPQHWKELGLFLTFLMDSSRLTFRKLNGPFWTLAVEWQFYMLLPWLALGFRWVVQRVEKFLRRRYGEPGLSATHVRWWTLLACLGAVIVWGVASRSWGIYYSANPAQTLLVPRPVLNVALFFLFGTIGKFLEDFTVGMLICCCYVVAQHELTEARLLWIGSGLRRTSLWLWGAGIVLLFLMALWDSNHTFQVGTPLQYVIPPYDQFSELFLSLGYGGCMTAVLFGPAQLRRLFEWRPLRWLGLISYSLYIWHLPILIHFSQFVEPYTQHWNHVVVYGLYWLCAVLLIIPFSYLFFICIERPWMRLNQALRAQ